VSIFGLSRLRNDLRRRYLEGLCRRAIGSGADNRIFKKERKKICQKSRPQSEHH
jgi:hypothetical protein